MSILSTEKSNGVRFYEHFPSAKDEPTFVLVHGLGASLDFWNAVAPGLARHRTIAFDMPGFGESDSPAGAYTLDAVTSLAEDFLDRLSVRNAVLVGHSLGGIAALRIAAQRPDMIRRLVLIDSTLLAVEGLLTRPAIMLRNPKLALAVAIQFAGGLMPMNAARAKYLANNRILRHLALQSYIHSPAALDPASLADAISFVGGKHAKNVLRVIPAARYVHMEKLMARLTQPVSLIWGQSDPLITQPDIIRARDLMPVDDMLAIPLCGHWPIIEKPQVVIDFLVRYGDR